MHKGLQSWIHSTEDQFMWGGLSVWFVLQAVKTLLRKYEDRILRGDIQIKSNHMWTLVDLQVHNQIQSDLPRMVECDKVLC